MAFTDMLRALMSRSKTKHPARRRFRPVVETLEDRLAPATFNVTTIADAGNGSLRQAILSANAAAGADTIAVSLGAGLHTISLASALPAITGKVSIDGSQSGLPKLELNGAGAGAGANGLVIKASGTNIKGLIINRFAGNGIVITNNVVGGIIVPTSNCLVVGCFIGTDANGTGAAANGLSGVAINGTATANRIGLVGEQNNLLSGNLKNGVLISGPAATGNLVVANRIGVSNAAGNPILPNGIDGVQVSGAKNNRIGSDVGGGNTLSGNGRAGVTIQGAAATGNLIQGNVIGLNLAGSARPNLTGVWIAAGANGNTIGGSGIGALNTISGNTSAGVAFTGAGTASNTLSNNSIGTTGDGSTARPNGLDGVRIIAGAKSITVTGNLISANGANGVLISGAGVTGNVVKGNIIGLNAAGNVDLGNAVNGVRIGEGAASNTIGGTAASDRNVISGNTDDGVLITGAGTTGNKVRGNYIGTDAAGAVILGNGEEGVEITGGATTNTVGGTAAGARNVISGNALDGVAIQAGASGNSVLGNIIGLDAAGAVDLGNGFAGVLINGGANNTVGGTGASARNVIAGNGADGVLIFGVASKGNKVLGNFIGTDAAGAADLGNASDGVEITAGAANNTVGGPVAGARNVIAGNGSNGVKIQGAGVTGNLVLGNFIGLNSAGTGDLGNTGDGVEINSGAANNTIGGTSVLARNVIAGNGANGVLISNANTTGNKVLGNFIGTDAAGAADLGNDDDGVEISGAADNTVGGTAAGTRNVISGNAATGVLISGAGATNNKVLGNLIGLNAAGADDLGNDSDGVRISGAVDNTVGGTVAAARNVISGNIADGIVILGAGATGNNVQGNFIGLNVGGTLAIRNNNGVQITSGAANNTVGGAVAGARNVISGNSATGVVIAAGTENQVLGNFIGTNAAGAADLGNGQHGVIISVGANNTIGGATPLARNVISGNGGNGVFIFGSGTTANKVQGNFIGVASNGTSALGNDQNGVFIAVAAAGNDVGGLITGEGNVIAHNDGDGVLIGSDVDFGPAGSGNSVRGNSIFANGESGIDLGPDDGVTANDLHDPDAGSNNLLNKPTLTSAFLLGDVLLISGVLNTELGKSVRIEFFGTPTLNAAGQAEGKTFLGFVQVSTSTANTVFFSTFIQTQKVKAGDFLTASATDELGNTSEFSLGLAIV